LFRRISAGNLCFNQLLGALRSNNGTHLSIYLLSRGPLECSYMKTQDRHINE